MVELTAIISAMRRSWLTLIFLLAACRAFSPGPQSSPVLPSVTPTMTATFTVEPLPSATPMPPPASPSASPALPTSTPSRTSSPLTAEMFTVRLHPDGPLYVGDQISFEVIAPQNIDLGGRKVAITVQDLNGSQTMVADFNAFGIGGRRQATVTWFWNTTGLEAGEHTVDFSLQPSGASWSQAITLLPRQNLPEAERNAAWATAESDCCLAYYVTATEAERDLNQLLEMLDQQAESAIHSLGAELQEALPIVFLPRVLGHGGFASNEIAVSYLDQNYAGSNPAIVIHHEMIHMLDSRLGGDLRPSMLVEGLAVYLSGGHFKKEPLMPRAAALLEPELGCLDVEQALAGVQSQAEVCGLSLYVPLQALADEFYFSQHEVGYLEAAALIEFMVQTWGWQAYSDFYRDIHPPSPPADDVPLVGGAQYQATDAALQAHFGLTLKQLEERFRDALRQQTLTAPLAADVLMTVRYYDTVRRYQRLLDPSAYFLTAWLPDGKQMREQGIVADFTRRPVQPENTAIETRLVQVYQLMLEGDFSAAQAHLEAIHVMLDAYE